ncbi:MAG: DNA translocase FtsK 4TM domain-containing protein [Phenylobacterium sp.]|nr:DNA translocase FtsK 4TM domain-containing protein [Phenylobacterium sp.]MDO8913281.1 DNA translocase FtsK 4TM domain-containing protein [Phenylobacterium sp.]MDP2011101.1 DNA translocase FtsK 4TM domain-containing protein [Phenylobacterium sp.]MDP3100125.1 DNA translocase FtsK 4TM domain-containing protein [Phenylobacterium sp.]MDP3867820.1 DNA translocase FtsK 4TM domain-containing protein [Phenylobacterium sp.]
MARVARKTGLELGLHIAGLAWTHPTTARLRGGVIAASGAAFAVALATYNAADPSLNAASPFAAANALGGPGATAADIGIQSLGLAAGVAALLMVLFGLYRAVSARPDETRGQVRLRAAIGTLGLLALAGLLAAPPAPAAWPLAKGLGGFWGDGVLHGLASVLAFARLPGATLIAALLLAAAAAAGLGYAFGLRRLDLGASAAWLASALQPKAQPEAKPLRPSVARRASAKATPEERIPAASLPGAPKAAPLPDPEPPPAPVALEPFAAPVAVKIPKAGPKESGRELREAQGAFDFVKTGGFALPELAMLAKPKPRASQFDEGALRQNAQLLESVLAEFGVKGAIDQIRPGPVVTLYELVPAAGVKSARVVALSDDIARSMSVAACRVSVVPGRNAIGIELPNARRETVYLRDLLGSSEYEKSNSALPMALGETIGGEPYIADLSKMPHLLIAGTTGSGKSVGVNAMILSILYRLPPEQCRFIMIDPKMLELSVYDGIPHLLAPVVTDPKKAIVALKWTVREMEDRYRRMSKIGVRNVASYNDRAREAAAKGEHFERTVQTGFDDAGRPIYESEKINPEAMPYLVVIIDEVADLMMVAGKDVEGAVQRLAQMARAAGIHLVMATQRPSVDVITGTIKANFPTRISFQVTSKIDSRTILGEQGAEQLLGQGDMLYMAGGGRVTRLHGPFVSDGEVEAVAKFLREQGQPQYLEEVTAGGDDEDGEGEGGFDEGGSGDDLYDRAVAVVTRDKKASTSYVQRRLQIGYNRAASLIERMENEGVVSPANHAGKREVLVGPPP